MSVRWVFFGQFWLSVLPGPTIDSYWVTSHQFKNFDRDRSMYVV